MIAELDFAEKSRGGVHIFIFKDGVSPGLEEHQGKPPKANSIKLKAIKLIIIY